MLAIAWATLPHIRLEERVWVATSGTKTIATYGQFLVIPAAMWLTLAAASYFKWRTASTMGAITTLALGLVGAVLALQLTKPVPNARFAIEVTMSLAGICLGMLLFGTGKKRQRAGSSPALRELVGMGFALLAIAGGIAGLLASFAYIGVPSPLVLGTVALGLLVAIALLSKLRTLVGSALAHSFIAASSWYGANYQALSPWLVTLDVATAFAACIAAFVTGVSGFRVIFGPMNSQDLSSFLGGAGVLLLACLVFGANCTPGLDSTCTPMLSWVAQIIQRDLAAAMLIALLVLSVLYATGASSEGGGAVALLAGTLTVGASFALVGFFVKAGNSNSPAKD
jgi:hypothetical protein